MDKLKKMFKKDSDKEPQSSTTSSTYLPTSHATSAHRAPLAPSAQQSSTGAIGGSSPPAQGVLLTTTYGDVTVILFSDKTPKVSFHSFIT
jgi:peptidyl-prolyl cis-trans isomerase-like 1